MTNSKAAHGACFQGWGIVHCLTLLALTLVHIQPAQAAGKKYALIVGVTAYRPGQPLPKLPYTENDANELAKVLTGGGYKVTLMTQAVAKVDGNEVLAPMSDFIRDQLDLILTNPNLKSDDIVLVALAGHGVQYEFLDGDQKTPKFYFCPTDADISKLKTANDITASNNLLDLSELYTALNTSQAGGKLLLVDACRNDPSKPAVTRSTSSVTLPPLPPPPGGIAAFFSCSANQRAFEDSTLKHGVFFHHVIQALKGDADTATAKRPADGQISLAELSEHVSSATYDFVQQKFRAKQAPELKGEFRLSLPLMSLAAGTSATTKPGELRIITVKGIDTRWHWIPPGEFKMGNPMPKVGRPSDENQVDVTLSKGFWMLETEVTQELWTAVMDTTLEQQKVKANSTKLFGVGPKYPMYCINHQEALEFCTKLNVLLRAIPAATELSVRLPSEAEWEYAARAGTSTRYYWGDQDAEADLYSWHEGNSNRGAHPVGQKEENEWGLRDMSGNVWEWCSDYFTKTLVGGTDPRGPTTASDRVIRGGGWRDTISSGDLQAGTRDGAPPMSQDGNLGFRLACSSIGD